MLNSSPPPTIVLMFFALFGCLSLPVVHAANSTSPLKKHVPVKALAVNIQPMGFKNDAGEPDGISVKAMALLLKGLDRPVDIQLESPKHIITSLLRGDADISMLFERPKLNQVLEEIGTWQPLKPVVLSRTPISAYEDLYGLTIGRINDIPLSRQFDRDPRIFTRTYANAAAAYQDYLAGKIDAIADIQDYLFYEKTEIAANKHELFASIWPLQTREIIIYVRPDGFSMDEKARLRAALKDLKGSRLMQQLRLRYLEAKLTPAEK